MPLPVFYTSLTKTGWLTFSHQRGRCADFEMEFYKCASRVGYKKCRTDCKKELADFSECATRVKQFQRYVAMQEERKKQGRPYTPTPSPDVAGVL